eukprot:jgi/Ulvmu1/7835/UM004_0065.1
MLQDVVNVTHIDDIAACVDLLYESMSGIERVTGVQCLGPFANACSVLQSKVVETEGEGQLGKIVRWMFKHLPDGYKPALNVGHNINMSHPVNIAAVPDSMLDSLGNPVDKEQYITFWSLQHSLYDVNVLYDGDKWGQCTQQIECVLKACSGPTQVEGSAAFTTASEGTVAYLSSPSLLTLQLQDVTFRRQQLVQIAMLLHYAQTCASMDSKNSKLRPPLPKIQEDCVALFQRVLEQLKRTGNDGEAFEVGLRNALQLEVADIHRKAELTQPKAKPAQGTKAEKSSTNKAKGVMDDLDLIIKKSREPWKPADWPLLAYDASLVPEGMNMHGEICGSFPSEPLYGLEQKSLNDKVKKDMKTIVKDMKMDRSKKHIADPMFQWRAMRLLSRANLKIYSECITEREANLEYAACEFLKDEDDPEIKPAVREYLSNLPPTLRELKKEAKKQKAQKKQGGQAARKRPGHESDSGNASHGTPAKKARTDAAGPSKRSDGGEQPIAPSMGASPLSARSAGEIPADDIPAVVNTGQHRSSDRGKDSSREPVTRLTTRELSEKDMEVARAAVRDAQDDAKRHGHPDAKRAAQKTSEPASKAGREDESHTGKHDGQRDRKVAGGRAGAEDRGGQPGKVSGAEHAVQGHGSDRGRGSNSSLPGPPAITRPRDGQGRAPLVAPSQHGSRAQDLRSGREREESNADGKGGASGGATRAAGGPEQAERGSRGATERRSRDVAGGMRGAAPWDGGNSERDGDRSGVGARNATGSRYETNARVPSRLLGNALNQAGADGPREAAAGSRRGGAGARGSPPGAKNPDMVRDRSGAADNGAPANKRARNDAGTNGTGGRQNANSSRYDRQPVRK